MGEGLVRFENVGLRYGLGPEVLRDLTFQIEPLSFQFLTGPSGAGKTSLLRLLFLSLRPTRGLITLFDPDVATLGRDALAWPRAPSACPPTSRPAMSIPTSPSGSCGCSSSFTSRGRRSSSPPTTSA